MIKPQIFISHISEESDFANSLKEWIEETLLGGVSLFVSSDKGESIPLGSEWLKETKKSLELASIILVLISHKSKDRKWIYFESGAGYVRGIPVIPICIGGITKKDLPVPLNLLQAIELPDKVNEDELLKLIAASASLRSPKRYTRLKLPKTQIFNKKVALAMQVTNKNFIEDIYENEVKFYILDFFLNNYNTEHKFTLSELEISLNLKSQKKRKYILKNLENLSQYEYVKKNREKKSTSWQITDVGKEMLKRIPIKKGLHYTTNLTSGR